MSAPRLHFRLPGKWHRVDLSGGSASEASIKQAVAATLGRADARAKMRAQLRQELRTAVESARQAEAMTMMFSTEISPGTPLPVSLVVYAPAGLRMSPALGTDPEKVLAVASEGLKRTDPVRAASLHRLAGAGGPVDRTHSVERIAPSELIPDTAGATRLVADYWVPVPGTKQVAMVRLSTPMGELENTMLSYFDVLIGATYFKKDLEASVLA